MYSSSPFQSGEVVNLTNFNLTKDHFKFGVLAFESDRYITVKESANEGGNLHVIEPLNNFNYNKSSNKAEAALMHPEKNIIALKAKVDGSGDKYIVQVWSRDPQKKLKAIEVNEVIVYWRWLNPNKLGIVTAGAVYSIDITKENEDKVKLFDRTGALTNPCQVINLATDSSEKWGLLTAISSPDSGKTIVGNMQLCLIEAQKSQSLEGHYGTFGNLFIHSPEHKSSVIAYFERKTNDNGQRVHITEVSPPPEGRTKLKKACELQMSVNGDFPIYMHISSKHGLVYVLTKAGFYYVIEASSASLIANGKISNDPLFIGSRNSKTDGPLVISKSGAVYGLNCDENSLVKYLLTSCTHIADVGKVATTLALNYKISGAENVLSDQFKELFQAGDYAGAARVCAQSPGTSLRNSDTINKFKNAQAQPGQPQPILIYFQVLLEKVRLNALESLELVGPVIAQGKRDLVAGWINGEKLEFTEDLGNLIKKFDPQLALSVFERCGNSSIKVQALIEAGQVDKAFALAKESGVQPDWTSMIKNLIQTNPEAALNLAKQASKAGANYYNFAEIFLQFNRIQELTGLLGEVMTQNKPEDAVWQTKVLELNLVAFPQVAEALFQMDIWKLYDRKKIAQLCEKQRLPKRALENYTDFNDIRRVILNFNVNLDQNWLVAYLSKLDSQSTLEVLKDLCKQNRQNLGFCSQVAIQQYQKLGLTNLISVFEAVGAYDAIHFFLTPILSTTQDPDVYYKYIEAGVKSGKFADVEKIIRETQFYDPVKVKQFLMDSKLADPRPLMFLCDMHGYVDDLVKYLFKNNLNRYIEAYTIKIAPQCAPVVLGTLIDLEAEEKYVLALLSNVRTNCPVDQLMAEFEKRNKLRLLESWIEARVAEGNQTTALHNALAKIYIDTNKDPQGFLTNNQYYDPKVVGKYAEEIDPHLAIIAYKRAWGQCDDEVIALTDRFKLYRVQAKYLVERRDRNLWASVLRTDNPNRREVVDYVVSSALPDSTEVEEVSVAVQAFLQVGESSELISLLEKIVLHNPQFAGFKKLQNLLLITVMRSETEKHRAMYFINHLDNFEGSEIATTALECKLYEEAFTIYKKIKQYTDAINVLLQHFESPLPRAAEFAERVNETPVWSALGNAYLLQGQVLEAIDAFLKSNDPGSYAGVIQNAEREEKWEQLIKYLLMCRTQIKDAMIDSELLYSYAKSGKNVEVESFISNPNSADLPRIGDRCYDEKLYEAAKIIFTALKNNAKIASCLIKLKQFTVALESAKKANTPKTWKELCIACLAAKEYRLANAAGMNIVIHPDHLDELVSNYEKYGVPQEAISLLEQAKAINKTLSIFTELGVLYAKYSPEKLLNLIIENFNNINVTKLMRVCERFQLWPELVYLQSHYDEYDNAIITIIEHSPYAWQHDPFCALLNKVSNTDLYYKAVHFYLEQQPLQLNDLLKSISGKLDLTKLIQVVKPTGNIALIEPFLKSVQNHNVQAVNDTLNELYLESEDYEALRESVSNFENIDQLSLAKATQFNDLLEIRRISAYLFRRNQKYAQSIEISKEDEQYRDAIETARESGANELIEGLLHFFIEKGEKEYFTVTLYTCYEYLRPDYVLELSWRFGLYDYTIPFFIQLVRDLTHKVETVQKKHDETEQKLKKKEQQELTQPPMMDVYSELGIPGLNQMPMLPGPGGIGMGPQGGFGGQFGGQQQQFGGPFGGQQQFGNQQFGGYQ